MDDSEAGTVSLLISGAITPHQYTRAHADGPLTSEYISEQTEAIVHDSGNDGVRHARIAHARRVLEDCDRRDENSQLKKLVADLSLDKDMLQSVIRKNSLGS